MKESPNCSFCDSQEETLSHLFIECRYVKPIWNGLQTLCNVVFSDEEKLFGLHEKIDDKSYDLLSHITIIVKQCIHMSRMATSKPDFDQVKAKILDVEHTERQIALRNSRLERHLNKWRKLDDLFLRD